MAKKWLKNGRAATFGQSWDGHNLAILHPIWTFDPTKMISSSRRIDWCKDLSSISFRLDFCFYGHFLPLVATWTMMGARTPNHLQNVGTSPTYPPQLVTENRVLQKNLNHPPPPLKFGPLPL